MKIDIKELRDTNKQVFWNLVYYFNDYVLPFDFILLYDETPPEVEKDFDMLKRNA